jgi:hypothetical protein
LTWPCRCCPTPVCSRRRPRFRSAGAAETWYVGQTRVHAPARTPQLKPGTLGGQVRTKMARGWSGAVLRPNGQTWVGPVAIRDARVGVLRELLIDLSTPGLCLVVGAGASHGVVPMSRGEIAAAAWEIIQAQGRLSVLRPTEREVLTGSPELRALVNLLLEFPPDAWDRFLYDVPAAVYLRRPLGLFDDDRPMVLSIPELLSPSHANLIWHDVFSPPPTVPTSLVNIFDVLEHRDGLIVSYNYDQIAERQRRFPVLSPHGKRPSALSDPVTREAIRQMAWDTQKPFPTDWHLILPEDDSVRARVDYRLAVQGWTKARSVVFVGYSFGGGADALSFADFAAHLRLGARVHVLCPQPDNADLCKQIAWALQGRPKRFRVHGQRLRWRAFSEAVLQLLREISSSTIRALCGREAEILARHDKN